MLDELQAIELLRRLLPCVQPESGFLPAGDVFDAIRELAGITEGRFNQLADAIEHPTPKYATVYDDQILPFTVDPIWGIPKPGDVTYSSSRPSIAHFRGSVLVPTGRDHGDLVVAAIWKDGKVQTFRVMVLKRPASPKVEQAAQ